MLNDAKALMISIFNEFNCIEQQKEIHKRFSDFDVSKLCPTCLIKYHSQRTYTLLCNLNSEEKSFKDKLNNDIQKRWTNLARLL